MFDWVDSPSRTNGITPVNNLIIIIPYDPKFTDRQVWANNVDPDQTAPLSGSALFAILSAHFS